MPPELACAWAYARAVLAERYARARSKDPELGASVVEWVVITVIVVVVVIAVGAIITSAVTDKARQVCTSINGAGTTGTADCSGG